MAVSKTHPPEAFLAAYEAGQRLFGENRVQEMAAKAPALAGLQGLELHLIGPLQNNKTGKAAELFSAVDTLDTPKTAARLNTAAEAKGRILPVLIEVKLSPEQTKHGVPPQGLPALIEAVAALPNLQLRGLMTVPPLSEDAEAARPFFRQLRELRDGYAQPVSRPGGAVDGNVRRLRSRHPGRLDRSARRNRHLRRARVALDELRSGSNPAMKRSGLGFATAKEQRESCKHGREAGDEEASHQSSEPDVVLTRAALNSVLNDRVRCAEAHTKKDREKQQDAPGDAKRAHVG